MSHNNFSFKTRLSGIFLAIMLLVSPVIASADVFSDMAAKLAEASASLNNIITSLSVTQQAQVAGTSGALSLAVTSPNGGETFTVGQQITIQWDSSNVDLVSIGWSDGPSSWNTFASNIPNTGSYTWNVNVGNTTNTQFKIRIMGYPANFIGSATDESNNFFTVEKLNQPVAPSPTPQSIQITSPNGNEVWEPGKTYTVTWNQQGVDSVSIDLMKGESWQQAIVVSNYPTPQWTTGSYNFTVPNDAIESNTYKIFILGYGGGKQIKDWSDNPFTVKKLTTTLPPPSQPSSGIATPRTYWATEATDTTATLTGSVNPNGTPNTYASFRVGAVSNVPSVVIPPPILLPAENKIFDQKAIVTGLIPNTTYSFTMVAQSSSATVLGESRQFTTKPPQSTISTSISDAQSPITTTPSNAIPSISLLATPAVTPHNGSATLTWFSANATSCKAGGGWSGDKGATGSETINNLTLPLTTFFLTCTGEGGSKTMQVSVIATQTTQSELPQIPNITNPTIIQPPEIKPLTFTERNLYRGMKSDGVRRLQELLAKDPQIYPSGEATGYYGFLTQAAVQNFQCKYNIICAGDPETTGYGIVGPKTMAKINEVAGSMSDGSTGSGGTATTPSSSTDVAKTIADYQKQIGTLLEQLKVLQSQLNALSR